MRVCHWWTQRQVELMVYVQTILFIVYFLYTLTFAFKLNKVDNNVFTDNQRLLHNVLIWLIPFFWIMIVKSMVKPTSGSSKFKSSRKNSGFYESRIGFFGHDEGHHHSDGGHGDDGGD